MYPRNETLMHPATGVQNPRGSDLVIFDARSHYGLFSYHMVNTILVYPTLSLSMPCVLGYCYWYCYCYLLLLNIDIDIDITIDIYCRYFGVLLRCVVTLFRLLVLLLVLLLLDLFLWLLLLFGCFVHRSNVPRSWVSLRLRCFTVAP